LDYYSFPFTPLQVAKGGGRVRGRGVASPFIMGFFPQPKPLPLPLGRQLGGVGGVRGRGG